MPSFAAAAFVMPMMRCANCCSGSASASAVGDFCIHWHKEDRGSLRLLSLPRYSAESGLDAQHARTVVSFATSSDIVTQCAPEGAPGRAAW